MNEILFFGEIICVFSSVLLAKKFFDKAGLLAWIPIATILADLTVAKSITLFGMDTTLGNVLFASVFLATDILTECYGAKEARKGIFMGLFGMIMFVLCSQIAVYYLPSSLDYVNKQMTELFTIDLRIFLVSSILYFIANISDVFLYEKIREKTGQKKIWLRNNISTITCNCLENFLFMFFGFYGMFSFNDCMYMALTVSFFEAIIGLCDTPFLYLALK